MKKSHFILILMLGLVIDGYCQNQELDDKYTPKKNAIFDNNPNKTTSAPSENRRQSAIQNVAGVSLGLLIKNTIAFTYERSLSENFTAWASLGYSYGFDPIQQLFGSEDFSFGNQNNDYVTLSTILSESKYAGGKPYLGAGLKFFNYNDSFDGGYFMLTARHSGYDVNWNTTTTQISNGNPQNIQITLPTTINNTAFGVIYGYQTYSTGRIHACHDMFFGFGAKIVKYTGYRHVEQVDNASGLNYETTVKVAEKAKSTVPCFFIGYSFGIAF